MRETPARILRVRILHDGIYRSEGGGERRVLGNYAAGPRGLLAAARDLREERVAAEERWGNHGMGAAWLEVAPAGSTRGRRLPSSYVDDVDRQDGYGPWACPPEDRPAVGAGMSWWSQLCDRYEEAPD